MKYLKMFNEGWFFKKKETPEIVKPFVNNIEDILKNDGSNYRQTYSVVMDNLNYDNCKEVVTAILNVKKDAYLRIYTDKRDGLSNLNKLVSEMNLECDVNISSEKPWVYASVKYK